MRKLAIGVITITSLVTVFAVSTVLAQSFFGFGSSSNNSQPAPSTSANGAMTQDQIQQLVKQKAQQMQDYQKQQLNQIMATPVPYTPPQSAASSNQPGQTNPAASGAPTAAAPAAAPQPTTPANMQPAPAEVNTYAAPAAPAGGTAGVMTSQPTTPGQNQIYTGFGSGNQGTTTPTGSSTTPKPGTGSSSGWTIKY